MDVDRVSNLVTEDFESEVEEDEQEGGKGKKGAEEEEEEEKEDEVEEIQQEKQQQQQQQQQEQEQEKGDSLTEDRKKKKRRRRKAGDWSGRQMALKKLKSDKVSLVKKNVPRFADAIREAREVLGKFLPGMSEDDTSSEDQASAMRLYMLKKYNVSSMVSSLFSYKPFYCLNS